MEWISVMDLMPQQDGMKILFFVEDQLRMGWYRKSHPLHGDGLFGGEDKQRGDLLAIKRSNSSS